MRTARILFLLSALAVSIVVNAKTVKPSVALVVDEETAGAVRNGLDQYATAIRGEGKDVRTILVPVSVDPQVIRDTLHALHLRERLEGAVLIGEIPVPMVRRAHHLATAFKMNPAISREKSSVPSDRFYDDFDLVFKPLGRDGQLWYYDLQPEGAQRVECDIYTARIKPAKTDSAHSFTDLITEFLVRAAGEHARSQKIDRVFHFGGHGNSSESFNARIDENKAYSELFGFGNNSGRVDYINFDEDRAVRERLLRILSKEEIDIVHLHTHGAVETQYISKEPYTYMPTQHAENVKEFLRSRMRSAKNKEKTRADLMASYDVPESWLAGWDDPKQTAEDSLRSASTDIALEDLDGFCSGPRLIMLDACFNGAFQHDDYVAARYAFGHGSKTLAVTGNSVNIIQDHWKNELIGLLANGVCIGNWIKQIQTLESHLFGDPTYTFDGNGNTSVMFRSWDQEVAFPSEKAARKMLKQSDPSVCGFGIKYLYRKGSMTDAQILSYLENDTRMNVRMEALMSIVRNPKNLPTLVTALQEGFRDSYELVRRMSARYASFCGDPALMASADEALKDPLITARVKSNLTGAVNGARDTDDAKEIGDPSLSVKERGFAVSAQRNKCNPAAVDPMLALLQDPDADKGLKIKAAEALGWYVLSFRRDDVYAGCKRLAETETDPDIKDELNRTLARLEDNAYCTR